MFPVVHCNPRNYNVVRQKSDRDQTTILPVLQAQSIINPTKSTSILSTHTLKSSSRFSSSHTLNSITDVSLRLLSYSKSKGNVSHKDCFVHEWKGKLTWLPMDVSHRIAYFLECPEHIYVYARTCTMVYRHLWKDVQFWKNYFKDVFHLKVSPLGHIHTLEQYQQWKIHRKRFHSTHALDSHVRFSKHLTVAKNIASDASLLPIRWRYALPKNGTWEVTVVFHSTDINKTMWPGIGVITRETMYGSPLQESESKNSGSSRKYAMNLFKKPTEAMITGIQHCGFYHREKSLSQQNVCFFSNGVICRMGELLNVGKVFSNEMRVTMRVTPSYDLSSYQRKKISELILSRNHAGIHRIYPEMDSTVENRPQIDRNRSRGRSNRMIRGSSNLSNEQQLENQRLLEGLIGSPDEELNGCGLVEYFVDGNLVIRLYNIIPKHDSYDKNPLIPICNIPGGCRVQVKDCRFWYDSS